MLNLPTYLKSPSSLIKSMPSVCCVLKQKSTLMNLGGGMPYQRADKNECS